MAKASRAKVPLCACGLPFPHLDQRCRTLEEQEEYKRCKRGRKSKRKGSKGEVEVIHLLQPIVDIAYSAAGKDPPQLKRTSSMQADGGGSDVCGLDWLALEVKRCETLALDVWWRQCLTQAKLGQMPVLVYRQNGRQWRARCYVQTSITHTTLLADMSIADFCTYFTDCLRLFLHSERR